MTPQQFLELKTLVTSLWGATSKWGNAGNAYDGAPMIRQTEFRAAEAAVNQMADAGLEHAPSIPKVMALARSITGPRVVSGSDCRHDGPWAIVAELNDGSRVGRCVGCPVERTFVPGELVTASEREQTNA